MHKYVVQEDEKNDIEGAFEAFRKVRTQLLSCQAD